MAFKKGASLKMYCNLKLHMFILLASGLAADSMLFSVELRVPRYVPQGGSALLRCDYNVQRETLHKVEWLRGHNKLLQFVKDRKPPFRHYSIVGAEIDKIHSNESQVMLHNLNFDATGYYSCKVSTETPIFTRASNEEELTVIQPQRAPPEITTRMPKYAIGDLMEVNCSSSLAHPMPHVTWLLNGRKVPEGFLRFFPNQQILRGGPLASATVQLSMPVEYRHVGDDRHLQLTCVSTIPAFLGLHAQPDDYADYQAQEVLVDVILPEEASDCGKATAKLDTVLIAMNLYLVATICAESICGLR